MQDDLAWQSMQYLQLKTTDNRLTRLKPEEKRSLLRACFRSLRRMPGIVQSQFGHDLIQERGCVADQPQRIGRRLRLTLCAQPSSAGIVHDFIPACRHAGNVLSNNA